MKSPASFRASAGGMLQTAQRIGLAIGQALIGAVFFAVLADQAPGLAGYVHALQAAMAAALVFILLALGVGLADLRRARRRLEVARA